MKSITPQQNLKKECAAANAQEGLISVEDLSVLTGVAASQLTKFAKIGQLEHFGEYHGRRFYNFQNIVSWALDTGEDSEARSAIQRAIKVELSRSDCPYSIDKASTQILWKTDLVAQTA